MQIRPTKVLILLWMLYASVPGVLLGCLVCLLLNLRTEIPEDLLSRIPKSVMELDPLESGMYVGVPVVIFFWLVVILQFFSLKYELAERYITRSSGILWRIHRSIPLEKITSIDISQGPLDRMLGFGSILIFTPSTGSDSPEETLIGVRDLHGLKKTLFESSESARIALAPSGSQLALSSAENSEQLALLQKILHTLRNIESKLDAQSSPKSSSESSPNE